VALSLLIPAARSHGASGYLKPDVSARVLEKAESHFRDGVELYQERNYRGALRKFLAAERACPQLFAAGYHVALAHRKLGEEEAAVAQFKKLNDAFPENIISHNDLGVIYAGKGKEESDALAVAEFEAAMRNGESLLLGSERKVPQVRVDLAMAYANLGSLQLRKSKLEEAEKSYRKAVEHHPHGFFGHYGLGNALFAMKRLGEAKAAYLKAEEVEPRNDNVHIALARCYLFGQERNPRFAIAQLEKIKPESAPSEVFDLFGDAYALLGNRQDAAKYYRRHLSLPGRNREALYKLGAIHYNEKEFEQAKKCLEEFVAEASKGGNGALPVAYKLLGDIALGDKDYEGAIVNYGEATKLRENSFSCYYGLAESYFHLEKYEEARNYLQRVLDGLPVRGNAEENELREKALELLKKIPSEK
jgi:tetratricopeptide (TPR) repeat protein